MVRVNQFIALAAVLALSLFAAQTTFAGPGGSAGDSFTIVGSVGGSSANLWVTDPLGAGGVMNEYEYQLFGPTVPGPTSPGEPQSGAFRLCAKWEAESLEVPVTVVQHADTWVWWSKYDGTATTHVTFGNNTTDTPTVMDTDGDGIDEIVVVRDVPVTGGTARQWIVRDGLGAVSSVAEKFLFGAGGTGPVPGNWDGVAENGDEPAVTSEGAAWPSGGWAGSPSKKWQWPDAQNCGGTGGICTQLTGVFDDNSVAYTSNGQTRPGKASSVNGKLIIQVNTAEGLQEVFLGNEFTEAIGNCNL